MCGAGHSEALVEEQSTTINPPEPGASIAFYRAALPLSRPTLAYVTGVSRRHRKSIGSVWRKLTAGKQALLVLLYLRKGETFAEIAAGFEISTATAWRYVQETVKLLAARAPGLDRALNSAKLPGTRSW